MKRACIVILIVFTPQSHFIFVHAMTYLLFHNVLIDISNKKIMVFFPLLLIKFANYLLLFDLLNLVLFHIFHVLVQ